MMSAIPCYSHSEYIHILQYINMQINKSTNSLKHVNSSIINAFNNSVYI